MGCPRMCKPHQTYSAPRLSLVLQHRKGVITDQLENETPSVHIRRKMLDDNSIRASVVLQCLSPSWSGSGRVRHLEGVTVQNGKSSPVRASLCPDIPHVNYVSRCITRLAQPDIQGVSSSGPSSRRCSGDAGNQSGNITRQLRVSHSQVDA